MQPQIVALLIISGVLAAQGYYFGFVRPPKVLAWLQRATFVLILFMMIPFFRLRFGKNLEPLSDWQALA